MLLVGDEAVVIATANLRTEPNGQFIKILKPFEHVAIVGGPKSDGNLLWWQVRNGIGGWVIDMAANKTIVLRKCDRSNFGRSMDFILSQEFGEVYDPNDAGGHTKWGIAQAFHPNVNVATMSQAQMESIYRQKYWDPYAAKHEWPLCCCVFDAVINMGQEPLRVLLESSNAAWGFNQARRAWYRQAKQFDHYGDSWLRRVDDLDRYIEME
jgi:hypothetical protein